MGRYGQRWWLGHDNRSSHQWWTNHTNWSRSFMVRKWWNTSITWTMENAPNRRYISLNLIFYISNFLKILLSRKSCWCFLFCGTTSTNQWRRNSNCHCCWSFLCSKTWIGLDRRSKRKSKLNNRAIKWIQLRTTGKILIFKSQFWSILLVGISMFISTIWQWMERHWSKLTRG